VTAPPPKALLMAAGLGMRLRPLTERVPKCLVPIAGRPLLDYWVHALIRAGVREALINTHHLPEAVRAYIERVNAAGGLKLVESYEPELLGSAGTVHANRDYVPTGGEALIVYSDNLSDVDLGDLIAYHRSHTDPFTMLLFRTPAPEKCGIAEQDSVGRIISFVEKPAAPRSDLANAGVYVMSAEAYHEIADLDAFDLGFDALPRFAGRMRGFVHEGYHRDIGDLESLAQAERDARAVFPHLAEAAS
jgi:NDP-sugar pyrophosphorylase family protein